MPSLEGTAVLAFLSAAGVLRAQSAETAVTLVQEAYLKASNTRSPVIVNGAPVSQLFGHAMAVSGDTLVVGAPYESSNATGVNGDQRNVLSPRAGAAYVFVRYGSSWTQQAYLKPSNTKADFVFGVSVAISGDTIVVGAGGEPSSSKAVNGNQNDARVPNAGAAYVFVRNGGTWSQQAYLKASNTPSSPAPLNVGPDFGDSVAIAGDTIAVRAPLERGGSVGINGDQTLTTSASGAVYVFVRSGTTWTQQAYLKPPVKVVTLGWFGRDIAMSGETLLVGDYQTGHAHVFVRTGMTWTQQATLGPGRDAAGVSVGLSGDTAVIGASSDRSKATGVNGDETDRSVMNAGAAYVFVRSGTSWKQEAYLKPRVVARDDNFGRKVAVDGQRVVVLSGLRASPQVYVFDRNGATWIQTASMNALYFNTIEISGDTLVAGYRLDNSNATGVNGNPNNQSAESSGAVFVYRIGSPPGAGDQTEAIIPGVAKTFALKVTGPAESALAFNTVAAPVSGTVGYDNESRQATYTPDIEFTAGMDSFTYRVTGPGGFTATATVRIELLDEARSPAKLIAMSSAMDGGQCAPDSLFRLDATWLNTGPAVPAIFANELLNTGGTLEESRLEPAEGVVESGAQIQGHFAIRLRNCARFRFRIGLFAGAAEPESVSPAAYLGGLWYESPGRLGYDLSIGPGGSGNDTPRFILTNKSETLDITRLVFTIGDTSRAFDLAVIVLGSTSSGVRPTIVTPDDVNDGVRSATLEVTFTGLTPGRSVSIATDLDRNNGNSTEDFTRVFFNNGNLPHATVRVEFSDGRVLSQTLPDGSAPGNVFIFSQSDP